LPEDLSANYARRTSKTINIRHVAEKLYRKLKARADAAGFSLPAYLLREFRLPAKRPTAEELVRRIARAAPVTLQTPAADVVRALRGKLTE